MTYLDTSALIRAWRMGIAPAELTRSHSVAEFYATLTRGLTVMVAGVKSRVVFSPTDTAQGAKDAFARMNFADFDGKAALGELDSAAAENVHAANIHDWMHAAVAASHGCVSIVTTNEKHFKTVTKLKLVDPAEFFKTG